MPTPEEEAAAVEAAKIAAATKGTETWHTKLPEDLRAEPSLVDFKDESEMIPMPVNVAKSFVHTKKLVGADVMKMPTTDDEWSEIYNKLGRPENHELYVLQPAEGVNPKLLESLGKDASWFKETAHKMGLSDNQATKLFTEFSTRMSDKFNETENLAEQEGMNAEIQLRTEFGSTYDGKKVLMQRAMKEIGGSEFLDLITATGVGKHPAFIRAMFKVGSMMAEDLGLDKSTGELIKEKSTIEEEIASITANKAYLDAKHPEHNSLVNKVAVLMQQLHGTKPVPGTVATSVTP